MSDGSGSTDNRAHARIKISLKIKYLMHEEVGEFQGLEDLRKLEKNAEVLDLSLGGMQIVINRPLPIGSFLRVYLYLPNVTKGLGINSEVVWSKQDKAGLCFVLVNNENLRILKDFLGNNPK